VIIRPATSDSDLEAWRRVRMAVVPNERAPSVAELRRLETPDRLLLVAELEGELSGSGFAARSEMGGLGSLAPRVLPEARRRGVGTALFRALAAHVTSLGFTEASTTVGDEASLAFAERLGWREVDRQVEEVRTIGREEPPSTPAGVELASLAERPELSEAVYTQVAVEAIADIPVSPALQVSREDWERGWTSLAEGTFLALADGEVVGCAGLQRDDDHPERAEHSLTAVRRAWRGRGIATALKQATIAWAAENGIRELYTWTQRGNESMRGLNERLGYVVRSWCTTVRGPVRLR
jgi:mycothiol synthase